MDMSDRGHMPMSSPKDLLLSPNTNSNLHSEGSGKGHGDGTSQVVVTANITDETLEWHRRGGHASLHHAKRSANSAHHSVPPLPRSAAPKSSRCDYQPHDPPSTDMSLAAMSINTTSSGSSSLNTLSSPFTMPLRPVLATRHATTATITVTPQKKGHLPTTRASTSDGRAASSTQSAPSLDAPFLPVHTTYKQLLLSAISRGTRAFILGYALRTIFSVVVRAFGLLRRSPQRILDLDALVGEGSVKARAAAVRLGLTFGGYACIFELVNGLLRKLLLMPASAPGADDAAADVEAGSTSAGPAVTANEAARASDASGDNSPATADASAAHDGSDSAGSSFRAPPLVHVASEPAHTPVRRQSRSTQPGDAAAGDAARATSLHRAPSSLKRSLLSLSESLHNLADALTTPALPQPPDSADAEEVANATPALSAPGANTDTTACTPAPPAPDSAATAAVPAAAPAPARPAGPRYLLPSGLITALAGGLASLSVLFQPADTHRMLALYVLARALQCAHTHAKQMGFIRPLPFGSEALFAACNGVIMYCYVLRPDALAEGFYHFIERTGPIHPSVLHTVRMTHHRLPHDNDELKHCMRSHWGLGLTLGKWRFPNFGRALYRRRRVPVKEVQDALTVPDYVWRDAQHSAVAHGSNPYQRLRGVDKSTLNAADFLDAHQLPTLTPLTDIRNLGKVPLRNPRLGASAVDGSLQDAHLSLLAAAAIQTSTGALDPATAVAAAAAARVPAEPMWAWVTKRINSKRASDLAEGWATPGPTGTAACIDKTPTDTIATALAHAPTDGITPGIPPLAKAALLESLLHSYLGSRKPSSAGDAALAAVRKASMTEVDRSFFGMKRDPDFADRKQLLAHARHLIFAFNKRTGDHPPIDRSVLGDGFNFSRAALKQLVGPQSSCLGNNNLLPCFALHPELPHSCLLNFLRVFLETSSKLLPLYASLAFVPLLLFKNIALVRDPLKYIPSTAIGVLRSSAFIGIFASVYNYIICLHRSAVSPSARESRAVLFGAGILSGLASIVMERSSRRTELALYVFPRALDAAVTIGRQRGVLPGPLLNSLSLENVVIWCTSMGIMTYCFFHQPATVSSLVYTALKYVTGVDPLRAAAEQQPVQDSDAAVRTEDADVEVEVVDVCEEESEVSVAPREGETVYQSSRHTLAIER